ncbi:Protein of unknown function [Gryllus bimaculatus]|nr:Protein of unknown function [Gryllus bimaculatus]
MKRTRLNIHDLPRPPHTPRRNSSRPRLDPASPAAGKAPAAGRRKRKQEAREENIESHAELEQLAFRIRTELL